MGVLASLLMAGIFVIIVGENEAIDTAENFSLFVYLQCIHMCLFRKEGSYASSIISNGIF